MTPEWTEQEEAFWAAACDADAEAETLWRQLSYLTRETPTDDAERVRRRTNAAVATAERLAEYVARMKEHRP